MPRTTEKWLTQLSKKVFRDAPAAESEQESSEGDEIPDWDRRPRSPSWSTGERERAPSTKSLILHPRKSGGVARSGSRELAAVRHTPAGLHSSAAPMEEQVHRLQEICRLQEGQIALLRCDLNALKRQLAAQAETSRAELAGVSGLRADVDEVRALGGLLSRSKEEDERRRERLEWLLAQAEVQVRQLQARVKEVALMPALTEEQVQQFETRDKTPAPTADPDTGNRQEERRQDLPGQQRADGTPAPDLPGQQRADDGPAPAKLEEEAVPSRTEGFLLPPGALVARCSVADLPAGQQQRFPGPPPRGRV